MKPATRESKKVEPLKIKIKKPLQKIRTTIKKNLSMELI
jgi:hypothetical protein